MIELVNGYVCHNCAEAALAKQGKDPNAKPGDPPDGTKADKSRSISAFAGQPATVLDGVLKGPLSANPVTATTDTVPSTQTGARAPQVDFKV